MMANGLSVIITISVTAMQAVGWYLICQYGPEARTPFLKSLMLGLGAALLAITLSVSSLPNMIRLVGPPAIVKDWEDTHRDRTVAVNIYARHSLGVLKLRPGWLAEMKRSCGLAEAEADDGLVSSLGGGKGPVAVAFFGVCEQTKAFIASVDAATEEVRGATADAHRSLHEMRDAIRDRSSPIIEREDRFLDAGDKLNAAVQRIRAADLSDVLEAGAAQIAQSIAELKPDSSFTPEQVEMVSALKGSLSGLLTSTAAVSKRLGAAALPDYRPVTSPDYITAIRKHWLHFIPAVAAAVGIDCFQIWAFCFLLVSMAGKSPRRRRRPRRSKSSKSRARR